MPPKKKEGPSKKTEMKKKEKIVEDKTFGLKNKKGSKQQKYIQNVQQQVKFGNQSGRKLEQMKQQEKAKKEDKKKESQSLNELFKPVAFQKVEKGADPKSVLCSFFKQGQCTKGDKCKFSHDLNIERKAEKRSMYVDMRDKESDTMENWDEEKLRDVVNKKHSEAESKKPKTDIICKHFLDALENNKYGWFWECPAGEKCFYRHALPAGFVLQKDKKKLEKEVEISIEELVERERASLGEKQTKVTYETFMAWKKKKIKQKADKARKETDKKKNAFKAGRGVGLSGRDMFTFRPDMATDDMDGEDDAVAYDIKQFQNDDDSNEGDTQVVHDITLEMFSASVEASADDDPGKLDEASGGGNEDVNVPIDEDLFAGDDEDLDELDQDLQEMGINP